MAPVISGLVGGALAVLLCIALSRWVPHVCNHKPASVLSREYRAAIIMANLVWLGGLFVGIALYHLRLFADDDWRGAALSAGGGSIAALLVLALQPLATGRSPKEAYVAYSISQGTPPFVLYGILVLAVAAFAAAVGSLTGS